MFNEFGINIFLELMMKEMHFRQGYGIHFLECELFCL